MSTPTKNPHRTRAEHVAALWAEERSALAAARAAMPGELHDLMELDTAAGDALRLLLGTAKRAVRRRFQAQHDGRCLDGPGSVRMFRKLGGLVAAIDLINRGQESRECRDTARQREAADRRRAARPRAAQPTQA